MEIGRSFIELVDMHPVVGECSRNTTDAVRIYREKCPNWRVPCHCIFLSGDHRLQETGTAHRILCDVGHPCSVGNVWIGKLILEVVEMKPTISTSWFAAQTIPPMLLYTANYVSFSVCKS
jgi:hypothetical protein